MAGWNTLNLKYAKQPYLFRSLLPGRDEVGLLLRGDPAVISSILGFMNVSAHAQQITTERLSDFAVIAMRAIQLPSIEVWFVKNLWRCTLDE